MINKLIKENVCTLPSQSKPKKNEKLVSYENESVTKDFKLFSNYVWVAKSNLIIAIDSCKKTNFCI